MPNNKDIIEQYSEREDFGFSAVPDSTDYESRVDEMEIENDDLITRLEKAEALILPLLSKLAKTADESDTIYWPNRKEIIEKKIDELLSITRVKND